MSKEKMTLNKRTFAPIVMVILVIVLIVMIITISKVVDKYTPTKENMSLNEYFSTTEGDKGVVIELNNEILDDRAIAKEGEIYLSYSFIHNNINERLYYDENENLLIYTTADSLVTVQPNENKFTVGKDTQSFDGTIMYVDESDAYIALDFIKKYSDLQFEIFSEPNRVIMFTRFGEYTEVTTKEDTVIRYRGGIKSPWLEEVTEGEQLEVLENEENWTKVASKSGVMGYIENKYLSEESAQSRNSTYSEKEHEHILMSDKVNLGWHQVTNLETNQYVSSIIANRKGMNVISPTWFYLNDNNGNIENLGSVDYVSYCHDNGVQVWGLVSNLEVAEVNTAEVLTHTSKRTNLVNQLIAAAIQLNLDGINVDFEALSSDVGDGYIQFIRELSLKCSNNELILSVDNYVPSEFTTMYHRDEQARFADYVVLMAYDEHYVGSDEGPVASLGFVKKGISDTIKEGVPAEQLILGVPFYTRVWIETPKETAGDDVESASEDYVSYELTSKALGMDAVSSFITENGGELKWNDEDGLFFCEFEKDGLTYKIWLEDVTSISKKLDAMKESGLAGAAFWKLELENVSVWDTIIKYMN